MIDLRLRAVLAFTSHAEFSSANGSSQSGNNEANVHGAADLLFLVLLSFELFDGPLKLAQAAVDGALVVVGLSEVGVKARRYAKRAQLLGFWDTAVLDSSTSYEFPGPQ